MEPSPEVVSAELLRALRGSRSQVAFSRRLGFRSNVAHAWEGGRRSPPAATVLRAARVLKVDVEGGLRTFYGGVDPGWLSGADPATPDGVAALLRDLRRDQPIVEVAARAGVSRFQASRWLSGAAEPRLHELLRMVEATTHRMLDFVAVLVDPASLPSTAAAWRQLEGARTLFWRMPAAQLVLLGLDLAPYRALPAHDDAWLAARLGATREEVADAVEQLIATGQIRWSGAHLEPWRVATVDTRRDPDGGRRLRRWWAEQASARAEAPEASVSTNAFTVSEADYQRLVELYRSTFRQVRSIVAASAPSERVVIVQHVLAPLDRDG
jgi:transcriptional regulator with XRE-family HTH domain